jgi:hypothetical protein
VTRRAALLPALLPLVLLAACSDGGSGQDQVVTPPVSSTAPSAPVGVSPAPSPDLSVSTGVDPSAEPSAADVSAGPSPASSPSPAAAPAPGRAGAAAAPAAAAPPTGARAGSYTYDTSGTVTAGAPQQVSGTSTLKVAPVTAGTQHTVVEGDQGRTETDLLVKGDGTYVARLVITNPAFSKDFRPSPAALLLPEPADPGRAWSWRTTSTDGKARVSASSRVLRAETVIIGGRKVAARVVETVLAMRGDVTYDGTTTTWYAPKERLPVKDRTNGKGMVSGFSFSADVTSTMRSTEPS